MQSTRAIDLILLLFNFIFSPPIETLLKTHLRNYTGKGGNLQALFWFFEYIMG
jgi:hypothetical protein